MMSLRVDIFTLLRLVQYLKWPKIKLEETPQHDVAMLQQLPVVQFVSWKLTCLWPIMSCLKAGSTLGAGNFSSM